MTTTQIADAQTSANPSTPSRRLIARRAVAATAAAFVLAVGSGAGPLIATASAQSSALEQSLGGQSVQKAAQRATPSTAPTTSQADLNAPPDYSAPGISKGVGLIGWAKAGAVVIGVLTLTIGIPMSKALKEAGNHHASGIRAGVMSVGGATLLSGLAGILVPALI